MSFQVALIDKSEIVQKMLSHCLHYFAAKVSRFDDLEKSQSHFLDQKPDVVFVDWEAKGEGQELIYSVIEKMNPVPVILLYRSNQASQIEAIPSHKIPHKLTKPLNPKSVRDLFTSLIPEVKDSGLHKFLKFPKTEKEKKEQQVSEPPPSSQKTTNASIADLEKESLLQTATKVKFPTQLQEETQILIKETFSGIIPKDELEDEEDELEDELPAQPQNPLLENPSTATLKKDKDISLVEKGIISAFPKTPSSNTELTAERSSLKLNKEDIDIDENTQNDLAPMAIKTSPQASSDFKMGKELVLSERDILRVLNKYKDSLEFQELMEKVLSDYAKQTVTNILEDNKVTDLLQQPMTKWTASKNFKKLVQTQIIQYVEKQLPLAIKEIIQQEIEKIIGD